MVFRSIFKKETIKFNKDGYTNSDGYSDYKVIGHRYNEVRGEVEAFIWTNKDKKTIRIQALINNKEGEFWGSKLTYFNVQDWPDSENKQKQLINELLLSDSKGDFLDEDWKNAVIQSQWELVVEFMRKLNFRH